MKDRLTPAELAAEKARHARIRTDLHASARGELHTKTAGFNERVPHRIMLLIWAFARGLSYRRVEPRRRVQVIDDKHVYEHNAPPLGFLQAEAEKYIPGATLDALKTWLDERPVSIVTLRAMLDYRRDKKAAIAVPAVRITPMAEGFVDDLLKLAKLN